MLKLAWNFPIKLKIKPLKYFFISTQNMMKLNPLGYFPVIKSIL